MKMGSHPSLTNYPTTLSRLIEKFIDCTNNNGQLQTNEEHTSFVGELIFQSYVTNLVQTVQCSLTFSQLNTKQNT